ncbi:LysR substrate-binding domain-containing protein [Roseovarius sp. THAF9]|uniref:LysR substrate-binding domain-containing protein n=1 Tax=Roseovarius sp. THAF9 TaxID=2587847 RepID=UPI001269648C|nr:LysR substrate-binding domain-containing protein [Roseovarius sp. THAF9]
MPKPHLPPLDLMEPFEAAARLGSFTRAADELSVTQSAISQRVRKLEALLDTQLFERGHRTITLTPEGRELLIGVRAALQHMTAATRALRQRDDRPRIRLGADTSMAQLWLAPRLAPALADSPPLMLDLLASDTEAELLTADIALLHGAGDWPGFTATRLFADAVFPVCTPDFLAHTPLGTPEDLLSAPLIDLDYTHWNWMNWGIWLTEAGLDPTRATTLMRTNSYMALLDAARAGLGVALAWEGQLAEDLTTGRLVRPIDTAVTTPFGYYLILRDTAEPAARQLAQSLLRAET